MGMFISTEGKWLSKGSHFYLFVLCTCCGGESLGEWIFNRAAFKSTNTPSVAVGPETIMAKTLNAVQRNWNTPSEFPCCPLAVTEEPIKSYANNLIVGSDFCRNNLYFSLVAKSAVSNDQQSLYVITESQDAIKPWALAIITYEDGLSVHTSMQSFFTQSGVEKQFCLAQGLQWTGEDSIDDFC